MAAIQEPKKSMTAYFLYVQDNRDKVQTELGTKAFGPVTKALVESWKGLSATAKAPIEKRAADLKAQYEKDMVAFKEAGGVAGAKRKEAKDAKAGKAAKKAKKETEADKPKKPVGGAYGLFLAENRAQIVKDLPAGSNPITAVAKKAGEMFKALTEAQKAPHEAKYQEKKAKYDEELKAWTAAKGAEAEDDDDKEEDEEEQEPAVEEKPAAKKAKVADVVAKKVKNAKKLGA